MRGWVVLVLCLGVASPVGAQSRSVAQQRFVDGTVYAAEGRWAQAEQAFRTAYLRSTTPLRSTTGPSRSRSSIGRATRSGFC